MSLKDRLLRSSEAFANPLSYIPSALRVGVGSLGASRAIRSADKMGSVESDRKLLFDLRRLLHHAATNIEFYRDFYKSAGFSAADLDTLDDWKKVPVVSKKDFQGCAIEHRCARGAPGKLANTGGTSGAPFAFLVESNSIPIEWAHMYSIWRARGYRPEHLKLRFGGVYFENDDPIHFHPRHNEYVVNANCPMARVVEAVTTLPCDRVFRWVHGYPSLVAEFAHALANCARPAADTFRGRLFGILLGSEFPAKMYRDVIERTLSTNIVSWYGHSERAVLARETADNIYQSLPTYGYAEAVLSGTGSEHHLVCTSLHNRVHPFIRYDTGDLIEPVSSGSSSLAFRITDGRIGDFVLDRNHRKLALTSIIFGRHHAAFDDLLHLQVRQDKPGRMTLMIVPRTPEADLAQLRKGFDFTGLDCDWQIESISAPIRTRAGKIKLKVD